MEEEIYTAKINVSFSVDVSVKPDNLLSEKEIMEAPGEDNDEQYEFIRDMLAEKIKNYLQQQEDIGYKVRSLTPEIKLSNVYSKINGVEVDNKFIFTPTLSSIKP